MVDGFGIGVLGRLVVHDRTGADRTPRGPLQRRLLAALALRAGEVVPADQLADQLWPDGLPANHLAALQTHVFRLRQVLPDGFIESVPPGYQLGVPRGAIDAHRFEAGVYEAARLRAEDPVTALHGLDEALAWWRGRPFLELGEDDEARIESVSRTCGSGRWRSEQRACSTSATTTRWWSTSRRWRRRTPCGSGRRPS